MKKMKKEMKNIEDTAKMTENYFGAIEKYNDQDYEIWNIDLIKDNTDNIWKYKIQYNQYYINNDMCTIISGAGVLSNYFDYKYSNTELLNMIKVAKKENPPFSDKYWWYIYKGVDLNRNHWNKNNPKEEVITFRVEIWSDEFHKLLEKGYSCQGGFKGDRAFSKDKKDDCKIDTVTAVAKATYWHSIYFAWKDNKVYVVDSYYGAWCNIYEVTNLKKLIQNKVYFEYVYFYIPKKDIMTEETKENQDVIDIRWAFNNKITNNQKNIENVKNWIYTQDVKTLLMIVRAIKYIKKNFIK